VESTLVLLVHTFKMGMARVALSMTEVTVITTEVTDFMTTAMGCMFCIMLAVTFGIFSLDLPQYVNLP
jgi:hypothetical protein